MKKVRIGLIGLGFMGSTHFRIYEAMKDAQIVALADVDAAKRKGDVSKVVGNIGNADNSKPLNLTGVQVYKSGFDLVKDPNVDVVDICCPTPDHADYIIAALAAGKHVFSEKPLCRDLKQAARVEKAVKNTKQFVNFGMCVRAWPEYRYTYEQFKAGVYGKVLTATFRRLSPDIAGNAWQNWFMDGARSGGALLDMHLHDTDLVRYFFGRPTAVTSIGANIVSKGGTDHVITLYHFDNGALVEAEGGWSAPRTTPFEMTFQIICEKATVRLMAEGFKVYWKNGRVESPKVEATTGWHKELAYFVDCVRKGITPDKYQTFDDVLDSFKIAMAEQKSVDTGKKVTIKY
ncbi:MAG: Inositol 2-dehydrogenase/D-chiro-inositol 3-dehydrogenase [Lentisphaerae bacterium ADurb.Bin242]|nr:MAG: Inositol 2-dehydrogenase/D-chiro-inositol 3-dehydrogenase [Lentisphaerae bacterium ADurb.Bin242]